MDPGFVRERDDPSHEAALFQLSIILTREGCCVCGAPLDPAVLGLGQKVQGRNQSPMHETLFLEMAADFSEVEGLSLPSGSAPVE